MSDLQQLAQCGTGWVAERAEIALTLQQQHSNGEISEGEYQELMQDLVSTDQLTEQCDDQDLKNALVSAVMIAAKLA